MNFIGIISFIISYLIIFTRIPRTDVCDTCTKLNLQIKEIGEGLPEKLDELKTTLKDHNADAAAQYALLKRCQDAKPSDPKWRTICTGKIISTYFVLF